MILHLHVDASSEHDLLSHFLAGVNQHTMKHTRIFYMYQMVKKVSMFIDFCTCINRASENGKIKMRRIIKIVHTLT